MLPLFHRCLSILELNAKLQKRKKKETSLFLTEIPTLIRTSFSDNRMKILYKIRSNLDAI